MPASEPQIDFTQFTFPSDQLTLEKLRKTYPASFDRPANLPENRKRFGGRSDVESVIGGTIDFERRLAWLEFRRVLNQALTPEEARGLSRSEMLESLADEYVLLGLASGKHHAEQLIRDIESQAAAQAQRHLGRSPS